MAFDHPNPSASPSLSGRSAARQARSMGEGAREAVLPLEGLGGFLRSIFTPKSYRVAKATRAFLKAKAAYDDALDRGDTRDQSKLWPALRAAREAQMLAERAVRS